MEYSSFYGGKQGASFVIVKAYKTIAEMVSCFRQGGQYDVVHYDEFVIIDTENKNNEDNGKIFKRGYDYQNEMGGAEYLGQIVGPSGPAPEMKLTTIKEVEGIVQQEGLEYKKGSGEYAPFENLIPGKEVHNGKITYNDSIKWSYCSIRNQARESLVLLGFKIPYAITEFLGEGVSAYQTGNLITRVDNEAHPFYSRWKISIPKGIKGDSLNNLKVVEASDAIQPYPNQADDIKNKRKVLVYEQKCFDTNVEGTTTLIYLGDFNMIDSLSLADDGTLRIGYTHDDDTVYSKKIKWIDTINLNTNNGEFKITYNNGTSYQTQLVYPTSITLDGTTGAFQMNFTNGTSYKATLKYPNNVKMNIGSVEGQGNQKINIGYTDSTNKDIGEPINYIMKMACNGSTGYHLFVLYSDPARRAKGPKVSYEGRSDWTDLGFIGTGDIGSITAKENDNGAIALAKKLPTYSSWFIIEEE